MRGLFGLLGCLSVFPAFPFAGIISIATLCSSRTTAVCELYDTPTAEPCPCGDWNSTFSGVDASPVSRLKERLLVVTCSCLSAGFPEAGFAPWISISTLPAQWTSPDFGS